MKGIGELATIVESEEQVRLVIFDTVRLGAWFGTSELDLIPCLEQGILRALQLSTEQSVLSIAIGPPLTMRVAL